MGNLHKWFSGSKSKDGKSGWVNVKTGGTCASDEPGEGTPKCVSSSKRASMTKSERESASRRKKAADPGQQQKSGAAKPTYVSTDKPKKMKKEQFSNWRDNTPEPMVNELFGLGKKKENKNRGAGGSWETSTSEARARSRGWKDPNEKPKPMSPFGPEKGTSKSPDKFKNVKKTLGIRPKPEPKATSQTKPEPKATSQTKPEPKATSQTKTDPTPKSNPYSGKDKLKPQSFSTAVRSGTKMNKSTPSAPGKIVTQQGNQKEQFSNWRDNYVATEHEFIDLIKPEPMVGISETKEGQMKSGREQYKKEKEEGRYGGTKPSNKRVAALMKKLKEEMTGHGKRLDTYYHYDMQDNDINPDDLPNRKAKGKKVKNTIKKEDLDFSEETKQDGPEPTRKQTRGAMKDIRRKLNTASHKDPDKKKTKHEIAFQKARAKAWGMTEENMSDHDKEVAKYREQAKKKTTMPKGDVGHDVHKRAVDQYNKQNPSKKVKEEFEISEEDKKGSGSGKKDACYKKVKASASVWPSAYASGRLVQCRKKGADNYGNSTKNEEWKPDPTEKRQKKAAKLGREEDIEKGKSKKYGRDEDKIKDLYKRRMAVDFKKKKSSIGEERLEELKCWKGYKRKKGSTPGAPGSCVKEGFANWRDDLILMEGVSAWQRKEGKNKAGGLNEKGRKSYERENPGSDLKAPQPEGGDRKDSFCARMGGMKKKLTSAKTANDPDSRINKALRKWKCNN